MEYQNSTTSYSSSASVQSWKHHVAPSTATTTATNDNTAVVTVNSRTNVITSSSYVLDNVDSSSTASATSASWLSRTVMARGLLLGAAALYGTNFCIVKSMGDIPNLSTGLSTSVRFGFAALATSPWLFQTSSPDTSIDNNNSDDRDACLHYSAKEDAWGAALAGAEVGLWNSIGYVAQAVGLETTSASVSAFLCSLAVVVVPFLDVVVSGKKLKGRQWIGAALALLGVSFLELGGDIASSGLAGDSGDMTSMLQPLAFGVGFCRLEDAMRRYPNQGKRSTAAQILAVFLACAVYTATTETVNWTEFSQLWSDPSILSLFFWTGVIATAMSMYMESVALKSLTACETTLLLSTEPLWGSLWAWLLFGEQVGLDTLGGGLLILTGCLYSSLGVPRLQQLLAVNKRKAILPKLLYRPSSLPYFAKKKDDTEPFRNQTNMRVCVIGGVHGNEYTGVWVIKAMQETNAVKRLEEKYPLLSVETLFANPLAHQENRRFLDVDLNRQFDIADLHDPNHENAEAWEVQRARELEAYIGPKKPGVSPAFDVAIDLHSTTTNMGTTLIFPEGDALIAQTATYIAQRMPQARILVEPLPPREYRPNVSSCAAHDFTIEVGPVPQGVLRHDIVIQTQKALELALEFLQKHQEDDTSVLKELGDSTAVTCYHTAVPGPKDHAMTGKIAWPSDDSNPNFPAWLVHPSIQNMDYSLVREGDPLFINMTGETIPYDGSHGKEIYVIFVNEAGYYYDSSGTGIGVAYKGEFDWRNGMLNKQYEMIKGSTPAAIYRQLNSQKKG
jgi:aspartoacylase